MAERAPQLPERLSPFADQAVPLQMPCIFEHDTNPELRMAMVRLQKADAHGGKAFTAAFETCKAELLPQLYFRAIKAPGLYEVHQDSGDKNSTYLDIWTICHVNDVRKYHGAIFDAKDSLQPLTRRGWGGKSLAAVTAGALGLALLLAPHHHNSDETSEVAPTTIAEPANAAAGTSASVLHKKPGPRRAPPTPRHPTSHPQAPAAELQQIPAAPTIKRPNPIVARPQAAGQNAFSLVTLNALGASHTDSPKGKAYGELPNSKERTRNLAEFIMTNNFDVIGLQEFQRPQRSEFIKRAEHSYGIFPDFADYHQHASENSIIWNTQRFRLDDSGYRTTRYFNGSEAKMPWVQLYDKVTGVSQIIFNTHDPADTRQFPHQEKWRAMDQQIHLDDVQRFQKKGLSTYLVGDFNSPACMLRDSGILSEAIDIATNSYPCPTQNGRIDHILVTDNVSVAKVLLFKTVNMTDHPKVEVAWVESAPAG